MQPDKLVTLPPWTVRKLRCIYVAQELDTDDEVSDKAPKPDQRKAKNPKRKGKQLSGKLSVSQFEPVGNSR